LSLLLLITLFHPGGAWPGGGGAFFENLPFFATVGPMMTMFPINSGGGGGGQPANGLVAEDGTTPLVAEDGTTFLVQE